MGGVEEQERIDGDEDTKETDVFELILDEVKKVRQTQELHGKELAEMKGQCGRRFETCSDAMRKLRERHPGDGKGTGSWSAEAAGE